MDSQVKKVKFKVLIGQSTLRSICGKINNYEELEQAIQKLRKKDQNIPESFQISYYGDDQDKILITDQEEFEESLDFFYSNTIAYMKLSLVDMAKPTQNENMVISSELGFQDTKFDQKSQESQKILPENIQLHKDFSFLQPTLQKAKEISSKQQQQQNTMNLIKSQVASYLPGIFKEYVDQKRNPLTTKFAPTNRNYQHLTTPTFQFSNNPLQYSTNNLNSNNSNNLFLADDLTKSLNFSGNLINTDGKQQQPQQQQYFGSSILNNSNNQELPTRQSIVSMFDENPNRINYLDPKPSNYFEEKVNYFPKRNLAKSQISQINDLQQPDLSSVQQQTQSTYMNNSQQPRCYSYTNAQQNNNNNTGSAASCYFPKSINFTQSPSKLLNNLDYQFSQSQQMNMKSNSLCRQNSKAYVLTIKQQEYNFKQNEQFKLDFELQLLNQLPKDSNLILYCSECDGPQAFYRGIECPLNSLEQYQKQPLLVKLKAPDILGKFSTCWRIAEKLNSGNLENLNGNTIKITISIENVLSHTQCTFYFDQ